MAIKITKEEVVVLGDKEKVNQKNKMVAKKGRREEEEVKNRRSEIEDQEMEVRRGEEKEGEKKRR